jgi:hypothetical protein
MRFLIAFLLLLLTACIPSKASNGREHIEWTRDSEKIVVTANTPPTLLITSSTAITDWRPLEACVRSVNPEITTRALKCVVKNVPLTVTVLTDGVVTLQIVNGFEPITPPVVIPK